MSFVDRLKNNFEAYCLERKAKMVEDLQERMLMELNIKPSTEDARLVSENLKTSAAGLRHQAAIARNQGRIDEEKTL